MFFYSPHTKTTPGASSAGSGSIQTRRSTIVSSSHLHVGQIDTRLSVQIAEQIYKDAVATTSTGSTYHEVHPVTSSSTAHRSEIAHPSHTVFRWIPEELEESLEGPQPSHAEHQQGPLSAGLIEICTSPGSSVLSPDPRKAHRGQRRKYILRKPNVTLDDCTYVIGEPVLNFFLIIHICTYMHFHT